jgi:hypothetical protein
MTDYKEYSNYENLKSNSLYVEEIHHLPEKFRTLPIKYSISYPDFVKYVNIAKSILNSDFSIHEYFGRYYTCKLDENGEHTICSVGITNNHLAYKRKDYELNRFNEGENYRINFNSCSMAFFITFIDLTTGEKFEIGE